MTTDEGKARVRDIGSGRVPAIAVSVTATAAAAALTQVAVTDGLNGATFTGTALATSATPTLDELEANFGVVGLQLNAAQTDIIAQKAELDQLITDVAALRTELVAMNLMGA